jgi:hypothetical protein
MHARCSTTDITPRTHAKHGIAASSHHTVTLGAGFRCKKPSSKQQQRKESQQQQQQHKLSSLHSADSVIDLGSADHGTDGASSAFELQLDEVALAAETAVVPSAAASASSSARRSHSATSSRSGRSGRSAAAHSKQQQQQQQQQQHTAATAAAVGAIAVSGKSYRTPEAQSGNGNCDSLNLALTSLATSAGRSSARSSARSSTHSSADGDSFDADVDATAAAAAADAAALDGNSVHSADSNAAAALSGRRLATPEPRPRRPDIWGTANGCAETVDGCAADALPQSSAAAGAGRRDTFMLRPAKLTAVVADALAESLRSPVVEVEYTE